MNSGRAVGIIPIAEPEFTKVRINENPLLKVPPARRGNRTRARFPSRSGGNLQEGGNCKLRPRIGIGRGQGLPPHFTPDADGVAAVQSAPAPARSGSLAQAPASPPRAG
jgi:hypothetical protein